MTSAGTVDVLSFLYEFFHQFIVGDGALSKALFEFVDRRGTQAWQNRVDRLNHDLRRWWRNDMW